MRKRVAAYSDLASLVREAGGYQPDPRFPVWDLPDPPQLGHTRTIALDIAKQGILRCLLDGPEPLYFAPEETPAPEDSVGWVALKDGLWLLPPSADAASVLGSYPFYVGNWRLYTTSAAPPRPEAIDLIRAAPSEALEYLVRHSLTVVVDSFHDDTQWRLVFPSSVVAAGGAV